MDLKKAILAEHSRVQTTKIVTYIGASALRFDLLIQLYREGPYRVTQRAAWCISNIVEQHPELVKPHLKKILDVMSKPGVHDAVKRNALRLLQFVAIPKRHEGLVTDLCFRFLQNKKEPVAIKVFAMVLIDRIAEHEPDLLKELYLIIEEQLPYSTAAFQSRGKRILAKHYKT